MSEDTFEAIVGTVLASLAVVGNVALVMSLN